MSETTKTFPRALIGKTLELKKDFVFTNNVDLISGKHMIVNKIGRPFLYMGDDKRQSPPIQIIASSFDGNLHYLSIESKNGIKLVMEEK